MHFLLFLIPLVSVTSSFAAPIPVPAPVAAHDHEHSVERRLPSTWYHHPRHPVHALFRRQSSTDEENPDDYDYEDTSVDDDSEEDPEPTQDESDEDSGDDSEFPEVGTDEWAEGFPTDIPNPDDMPQAWKDALNKAVKAKKIPNIPKSSNDPNATPAISYPKGVDPKSPEVCSSSFQCRNPGSLWDAPDGYFGTAFDDGPLPASATLLDFLQANEEKATHFMIGSNILKYPDLFKTAFEQGNDIAVHTYTHRPMTTLTNEEIVAELGWTMQLIRNSTGGLLPRFWRPPYGDSDTRVQAIAHEIFGLRTIIWNTDTNDWNMATGQKTKQEVDDGLTGFINGPQSPGLITLEHESTEETVQAFIKAYPQLIAKGWKLLPVTQLFDGLNVYQNVQGSGENAQITPHGVLHEDTDAGDDLDAPIEPSAKTKENDNGALGANFVAWSKSGVSKAFLMGLGVMLAL